MLRPQQYFVFLRFVTRLLLAICGTISGYSRIPHHTTPSWDGWVLPEYHFDSYESKLTVFHETSLAVWEGQKLEFQFDFQFEFGLRATSYLIPHAKNCTELNITCHELNHINTTCRPPPPPPPYPPTHPPPAAVPGLGLGPLLATRHQP